MLGVCNGIAYNLSGSTPQIAPNAVIEVRREDNGALASIFSDEAGTTPITNPSDFTGANGIFTFYAVGISRGYSVKVTDGAASYTLHNVPVGTAGQIDLPAIGTDGHLLMPASGVALWLPGPKAERVVNGELFESHAANAVTYTLKSKGGADLSATNPCFLLFPRTGGTDAGHDIVKVTANISVTVSSGSTLGHASAIPQHTFVYAINNSSVVELAVSNLPPSYPGTFYGQKLLTTTAEGGAGAADSATGVYSTTARNLLPYIPLAKVRGTQTTAGTWAVSPSSIEMWPYPIPSNLFAAFRNGAGQSVSNATDTKMSLDGEDFDPDAVYDNATNFRFQPNIAGYYHLDFGVLTSDAIAAGQAIVAKLFKNGADHRAQQATSAGTNAAGISRSALVVANGTTDFFELYGWHNSGSSRTFSNGQSVHLSGHRIGAAQQ